MPGRYYRGSKQRMYSESGILAERVLRVIVYEQGVSDTLVVVGGAPICVHDPS